MSNTSKNNFLEFKHAGRFAMGRRAAILGLISNLFLVVIKAVVGITGHSEGLVADAAHSAGDFVNSVIVLISLFISRKPADSNHPYGHGRAEALSSNICAFLIGNAGAFVGWDAWQHLQAVLHSHPPPPDWPTFWVASGALVLKLGLTFYVGRIARHMRSKSVQADARDHLLDVIASLVVIGGILGSRFGYPGLDPLAGLIVAAFILFMALRIIRDATEELMDTSISPELGNAIATIVGQIPGVLTIHAIAGRTIASDTVVELHVAVDPNLTIREASRIIDIIKQRLISEQEEISGVVVELNSETYQPDALAWEETLEDRPLV